MSAAGLASAASCNMRPHANRSSTARLISQKVACGCCRRPGQPLMIFGQHMPLRCKSNPLAPSVQTIAYCCRRARLNLAVRDSGAGLSEGGAGGRAGEEQVPRPARHDGSHELRLTWQA